MDSFREHPDDFEAASSPEVNAANDVAAAIGTDERRMHVRAYNHWVSLLEGRDFPSIEDLDPANVEDFAAHSVLLDFTCGRDNPAIPYIGAGIREECGLSDDTRTISDVPSRSLLSRLTDHYLQIIANRSPIGFEAEFANQREETICYRGILMPFSSDGDTIDFIYGVINWKHVGDAQPVEQSDAAPAVEPAVPEVEQEEDVPLELADEIPFDLTDEIPLELTDSTDPQITAQDSKVPAAPDSPPPHFSWEDGPLHEDGAEAEALPEIALDADAALADRLWAARETAEAVKAGEGRTRTALYRTLSLAYDFAIVAQESPEDYAELLEESGVKVQARAPMTAVVKLVFGVDYDKARLTEFAAALSYGQRQDIALGAFQNFIEKQPGGLKALVSAERQARRPEPKPDVKGEVARAKLRAAPSISLDEVPADEEFAVILTRRGADGTHEPVAIVDDEALLERAIRRTI
jgi:hypothetical protein